MQRILTGVEGYRLLLEELREKRIRRLFLVCGKNVRLLPLDILFEGLKELHMSVTFFSEFKPNPCYESVVEGVERFRQSGGEMILAIGGGSAMDVAKCIKLYSTMDPKSFYLGQEIAPNQISLFAIPTTAGTGSEATQFAVIYYQGEKQSITHPSCIPSGVLFDARLLRSLPNYQKKSAMLDALCHGIESAWSLRSKEESKGYSLEAVRRIVKWMTSYLEGDDHAAEEMLLAANLAGRAINITQTTAAHAMSYKLTSFYQITHGHSAAICLTHLWRYMRTHLNRCVDPRGANYLTQIFTELAEAMECPKGRLPEDHLADMLQELDIKAPEGWCDADISKLAASVNPTRLKNNPVVLDDVTLEWLYRSILSERAMGQS